MLKPTGLCGIVAREDYFDLDMILVREVCEHDAYHVRDMTRCERVVDVGAHIGSFARRIKNRFPDAQIVCVEPDPAHHHCLGTNTVEFDDVEVLHMAMTYSPTPVRLYSVMGPGMINTGLSYVDSTKRPLDCDGGVPHMEHSVETVTLEDILNKRGWDTVDVVKLDCEGAELSILQYCDLDRVQQFVGEWHGRNEFMNIIASRFTSGAWDFRIYHDGPVGFFSLSKR